MLETNLVGPFRLTKVLAGAMAIRGAGVIVHISSDAAVEPYPRWGAYAASKAAQDHLSKILAAELDGTGVRVLAVDPGEMDTVMHAAAIPDADRASLQRPADVAATIVAMIECRCPERCAARRADVEAHVSVGPTRARRAPESARRRGVASRRAARRDRRDAVHHRLRAAARALARGRPRGRQRRRDAAGLAALRDRTRRAVRASVGCADRRHALARRDARARRSPNAHRGSPRATACRGWRSRDDRRARGDGDRERGPAHRVDRPSRTSTPSGELTSTRLACPCNTRIAASRCRSTRSRPHMRHGRGQPRCPRRGGH